MSRMQNEAIRLAEMGYRIFPCQKGKKTPATTHGCLNATSDLEQIEQWWTMWPEANIGYSTDWLLVVDVDVSGEGVDKNPWLDEAMLEYFEGVPSAMTPSGGRHFYFRQPAGYDLRNTASKLAPKVDTRANGGYVVAPPSVLDDRYGKAYIWVPGCELDVPPQDLPEPPDWLLERLTAVPFANATEIGLRQAPDIIPDGKRNDTLYRLACGLRRYGLSEEELYGALCVTNNVRCAPPMPDSDIRTIARQAAKHEPDQISVALVAGDHLTSPDAMVDEDLEVILSNRVADPGYLPEGLTEVPGLIGKIVNWNLETAYRAQPELALAGAIALMGSITGQKVCDVTGMRTNIYCLGVCGSGGGKEAARQVNKAILEYSGLDRLIGSEGFASHAGIVTQVEREASALCQIDELGKVMQAITDPRAPAHLKQIITVLLKLFTSSGSIYKGDAYADIKREISIRNPNLCLYGTSVPESLFQSLTEENLTDGFVSRLLIFEARDQMPPLNKHARRGKPPQEIVEEVRWWGEFTPKGSNLNIIGGEPQTIDESPEATRVFDEVIDFADKLCQDRSKYFPLWTRAIEKTRKLALLYTLSENKEATHVTGDAAQWAWAVVKHLTERVLWLADRYVSAGRLDSRLKVIQRLLEAAGDNGVTKTDLWHKTRSFEKGERDEAIKELAGMGLLVTRGVKANGRTRDRMFDPRFVPTAS